MPIVDFYESNLFRFAVSDRILELIILATEACNFRCTYCYETFQHGRIRPEVVTGIKALISRRAHDLDCLKISWFGGEPLLALTTVLEVSRHASNLQATTNLAFISDMTTNAYLLTGEALHQLASAGVKDFQISLDGPKHQHDRTRVRANGAGSFDQIWANLLTIKESDLDVRVTLRVHVTTENFRDIPSFVAKLEAAFLRSDHRFGLILKPVERLGGPRNDTIDVLTATQRRELTERFGKLVQTGKSSRITSDATSMGNVICYAARPNSFVIRADGRIGKCTVALSDDRNVIGSVGEDGSVSVDNRKLAPWIRGLTSAQPMDLECPFANFPALP